MIVPTYPLRDNPSDYVSTADVADRLPAETIHWLDTRSYHVGLDGQSCWADEDLAVALMEAPQ
jgi:hypothetical protein